MSRQIDLTKPLSDEDREYLLARNRKRDVAIADGNNPPSSLPDDSVQGSTERRPDAQDASVGAQNTDGGDPADNPLASPATERTADATEDGDNYDDESAWSYADIKDEVKSREAEDSPALNSSREDLISWLRQDDARS